MLGATESTAREAMIIQQKWQLWWSFVKINPSQATSDGAFASPPSLSLKATLKTQQKNELKLCPWSISSPVSTKRCESLLFPIISDPMWSHKCVIGTSMEWSHADKEPRYYSVFQNLSGKKKSIQCSGEYYAYYTTYCLEIPQSWCSCGCLLLKNPHNNWNNLTLVIFKVKNVIFTKHENSRKYSSNAETYKPNAQLQWFHHQSRRHTERIGWTQWPDICQTITYVHCVGDFYSIFLHFYK